MIKLVRAELTVIGKRKASWVVLAIMLGFLILNYLLFYFAPGNPIADLFLMPEKVFQFSLFQLSSNGILLAAIFGGLVFGSPFSWGVYETRFVWLHDRTRIYFGVVVSSLVIFLIWLTAGLATGHLLSFSLGFAQGSLAYAVPGGIMLPRALVLTLLIWVTWFMLGSTIALWTKSTAMGIGLSLAYFFLERIVIFAIPGFRELVRGKAYLFLGQACSNTTQNFFSGQFFNQGDFAIEIVPLTQTVPVIVGYFLVFVFLSWVRFVKMDLTEH